MAMKTRTNSDGTREAFVMGQWVPMMTDGKGRDWAQVNGKWVAILTDDEAKKGQNSAQNLPVAPNGPVVGGAPTAPGGLVSNGPPEQAFRGAKVQTPKVNQMPASRGYTTSPYGNGADPDRPPLGARNEGEETASSSGGYWNAAKGFFQNNWLDAAKLGLSVFGAYGAAKQQARENRRQDRQDELAEQDRAETAADRIRRQAIQDAVRARLATVQVPSAASLVMPTVPGRTATPQPQATDLRGVYRDPNNPYSRVGSQASEPLGARPRAMPLGMR